MASKVTADIDRSPQRDVNSKQAPASAMEALQMPVPAWTLVKRMFDVKRMDYEPTEDGARQWTGAVAEQLKFSDPAGGWCHKSAGAGRRPSKDVIARQVAEHPFEGWEVLTGAGNQGPRQLTDPPTYHDLTNQLPIEVTAFDHLQLGTPPAGDQLDRIEEKLDRLLSVFRV